MIEKNRLWALTSNEETGKLAEKYSHFLMMNDHCLIISSEQPPKSVEVNAQMMKLLSVQEWEWIYGESDKIRAEEAEKYTNELMKYLKDFSDRYIKELEKLKGETCDGQSNTGGNETDGC